MAEKNPAKPLPVSTYKALGAEAAKAGVSVEDLAKALDRLNSATKATAAMEAAKAKMGQMTQAAKRAAVEQKQAANAAAKQAKEASALAKANSEIEFEPVTRPLEAFDKAVKAAGPEAQAAAAAATMWAAALIAVGAAVHSAISYVTELVAKVSLLRAQFMALARGGPGAGAAMLGSLQRLAKALPFSEAQVEEWGKALMMAKLQGRDLENAVKAVAGAAALMGDSGAAAAQSLFETLARGGMEASALVQKLKMGLPEAQAQFAQMGLRVEDVAAAMGMTVAQMKTARVSARQMAEAVQKAIAVKAAGPLGEMMLQWPVLIEKVREGFRSLFDKAGKYVKPFMKAAASLFKEFFRGGSVIKFLQPIVTAVFSTLFRWATAGVNAIHAMLKAIQGAGKSGSVFSGAVKVLGVAWKMVRGAVMMAWGALKSLFGILSKILGNAMVLKGLKAVFTAIAVVIAVVVTVIAGLIAAFVVVASAIASVVSLVAGALSAALGGIVDLVSDAIDALSDFASGAYDAAADFVGGLVRGIVANAGAVISAVSNLANGAIGAFKSILGIASPSRVMMKMGGFAAEGAAQGVERGADRVEGSASKLGGAVAGGAAKGIAGGAKGGKGAGLNVTFEDGAIRIDGAGKSGLEITEEMLAAALERLAAAQGLMGAT